MFQGIFKSAINDANKNYIFGTGSIPIQIKSAQLATFVNGTTKQQGYQVAEVNKLISTMLTGWSADGNKPKSMSDNYLELILSCDNGFVVKKRLQFPHIIAWKDDSTPYNIADIYKEFNIDNWLKADDFENPDITLVVEPTDEILTTSTATPPEVTTTNSGRFYLYYRNLPVGVNRIHIDFHIKTRTEPIDFDLEVLDGLSWKDAQIILASNEQAKINILLGGVKDVYKFTGAEGEFDKITMHEWSELYQQIISLNPNNKFTHDLYFYLYEESTYIDLIKGTVIGDPLVEEYSISEGSRLQLYIYPITRLGKWKFRLDSDSTEITTYQIWAQNNSSNLGHIECTIGVEYEYDLPVGTTEIMFFNASSVSNDTFFTLHYTVPSDLDEELAELHKSIAVLSKTDGIIESGSELTQDNVNLLSERSHKLNVTNTNVPVVAFIFDDNYVQSYVDLFNERGLKLTFAIIGNVNKSAWATTGNAIRKQVLNGHGTCAHGVVGGVSVTGSGVDTMNDADVKIATEGENKAFDDYKLSHRGLVQYNTWEDNPHTWALVGRYYDYIVGFDNEKCINTPPTTDLYQLRRMWTDYPNMLDSQKAKVDAAIAKGDCLLIFGGHFERTGQGGTYSTMEEFVALLDYVAEKVSAGQMLSLNMDDAVDMLWGRAIAHNVVMAPNYSYRNPIANSMKIENGLKICTNVGTKAIYSMRITGTTVAGAFTINLGDASKTTNIASCQSVTINTTAGESITSVISKIVSSIYKAYTVRSFSDGEVVLYRDINGVTFTPYITNNTSELVFDIVQITEGTEAVWE